VGTIIDLANRELPPDCYVYKHSTRCGISAAAAAVVRSHDFDLTLYWVNVIEQRDLSNWVASAYGVQHQSPQLIEVRGGVAKRSLSHYDISEGNL
jgi:bacillithiol system protein YtxJ